MKPNRQASSDIHVHPMRRADTIRHSWLLALLVVAGFSACGGSAESGTRGAGGSGDSGACVSDGDPCSPGASITACALGVECCVNVCQCSASGVAKCHLDCDAGLGAGASCNGKPDAGSQPCPDDYFTADGTPCSDEGKTCSDPCTDPCQFCNSLTCENGRWVWREAFPMPCTDGGDASDAADEAGDAGDAEVRGDSGAGAKCTTDTECQQGLECCYPCGVQGCDFECMAPAANGECPMFP